MSKKPAKAHHHPRPGRQKKPRKGVSLRFKGMQILVSAFLIQLIIISLITQTVLMSHIDQQEVDIVGLNTMRALNALNEKTYSLGTTAEDWAVWDDTYSFAKGENADYVEVNLQDNALENLKLNFLFIYNSSGELISYTSFDLGSGREVPTPVSLLDHISDHPEVLNAASEDNSRKGIIMLPEGPAYFASHHIFTSSGEGPSAGTLIMGKYLNDAEIASLAETTRLSVMLYKLGDPWIPAALQTELFLTNKPSAVISLDEGTIAGYVVLEDVYGEKVLLLVVEENRVSHNQGLDSSKLLMGSALLIVLIFFVITGFLVEKTIVSRLTRLGKEIAKIGSAKDISGRVEVEGNDELAAISYSINKMLGQLEKAQQKLRESEEKYESLVEKTTDGVLIVQDAVFKFANQTAADLLGYTQKELKGMKMLKVVVPKDRKKVLENNVARMSGKPAPSIYTITVLRKDGSKLPIELTATIINYMGRPAVMVTARDITLRKKEDEIKKAYTRKLESEVRARTKELITEKNRVEELSELKDRFIKDAGHELQGPLSVIMGNLTMLKDMAPIGKEKTWYGIIEMIERNATRLSHSIEMMLELVVLGAAGIKHERIYLRELLKEIYNESLPAAKAKGLKLELESEQYVLMGDKKLLKAAIKHIINNAIKFTVKGGVKIRVVPSRNSISIFVSDTGTGISPKNQKRILDRFFKVDPSAPGMGIGLSVTKEIINKHNGEIRVKSRLGKGTTIEVVLPRGVKK